MRSRTGVRIGSLLLATATLASLLAATAFSPAGAAPSCAPQGCWTKPFSPLGKYDAAPPQTPAQSKEFPAAASAVVLPNGQVVYWNGLQGLEDCGQVSVALDAGECAKNSKSKILDLTGTSPLFYDVAVSPDAGHDDLFCSDQRLLEDGTLLDTGGTNYVTEEPQGGTGVAGLDGLTELYGSKNTRVLDQNSRAWKDVATMHDGRWYPTMLTLPNGNEFVASGVSKLLWNSNIMTQTEDAIGNKQYEQATAPLPENVHTTETWSLANGGWTLNPTKDNVELPLFARLHLLPDGKIFYSSAGQMWGPAGESINELNWMNMKVFDPNNTGTAEGSSWSDVGMLKFGNMSGAMSVLMPLDPNDPNHAKVLVAGGTVGPAPGTYLATNFSQMVTLSKSGNSWSTSVADTGNLVNRRWFSSSVLLPDGEVLAFNGADKDEVVLPGSEMPVHQAEIFNPKTNQWTGLSSDARDRTYHNSAILLPDGSILVGGHAPIPQGYGGQGNALPLDTLGFAHNLKDPSFERFFPPYLFKGDRPQVLASQSHATWGGSLQAQLGSDPAQIDHWVLSRLPAQTHITDADARTILLGKGTVTGQSVTLQIPNKQQYGNSIVTPGYYYLFAIGNNGVPSVATIVQVAEPGYYDGRGQATPIQLADQDYRTQAAAAAAVPAPAARTKAARTSTKSAATKQATSPVVETSTSTPIPQKRAAQVWMIVLTALMGAVLTRRIVSLARARR
jgi:hypothetical protein